MLRPGNVHTAEGWREVLEPVIARYRQQGGLELYFRGDAGFAKPEVYELLEAEDVGYAIRLPANAVLQERIGHLLTRPVGRPPKKPQVFFASFSYQAQSWTKPRRVVAKVEWHRGELYPRVGFIVTNLKRPAERVVKFYNGRGTAEQWIRWGKAAPRWTRLSCRAFRANAVRLQLFALAYNLANFLRTLALPDAVAQWSLSTLRAKLVKACPCGGGDRRPDRAPRPLHGLPAGRGGGAAGAVSHDLASDRPLARTARGGGLTGANHGSGRSRGENHAPKAGEARRKDLGRRKEWPSVVHAGLARASSGPSDWWTSPRGASSSLETETIRGISA